MITIARENDMRKLEKKVNEKLWKRMTRETKGAEQTNKKKEKRNTEQIEHINQMMMVSQPAGRP